MAARKEKMREENDKEGDLEGWKERSEIKGEERRKW